MISIIVFFYAYSVQNPILVVTVQFYLTVLRDSSKLPGLAYIFEQNTNVSIIKWPQTANEKIDVNPRYPHNETRTTPVQFAVSVNLDEANKTVYTSNLTITGEYSAVASLTFPGISHGIHSLTIAVYVPGYEEHRNQLTQFITIP
jgi:hypothetical protein